MKIKKDAIVLTSRDLLNGFQANTNDYNIYNMTPLQMIPALEKDEDWKKWNLDWLERVGLRQLSRNTKRLIKNYHLANGILDRSDYMICPENEMSDMIGVIASDADLSKIPLKFFPLIPNVINIMVGEFSKRDNRMIAKAIDDNSVVEIEEQKLEEVRQVLLQREQQRQAQKLMEMGIDMQSQDPKVQQFIGQQMDTAAQLAAIQTKYKTYRSIPEQWANHMLEYDEERFNMYYLESIAFRDMLVTDREFWHVKITEEDYQLELWNPINVFYHKSPDTHWISEGNYAGRLLLMSIPDVIDRYGSQMTEEQLQELKNGYKIINSVPLVDDAYRDQYNFYNDYSKPYPKSVTNVTWGQYMDGKFTSTLGKEDNNAFGMSWYDLTKVPVDYFSTLENPGMVRVTEVYWKSQRKVGKLTRKFTTDPKEEPFKDTVDESYVVTEKPIYDKSIHQVEKASNLIFGEHIDWLWINETRYGTKINSSLASYYTRNYSTFEPIYIGGDAIPFQFKGQNNLYGCRLPVEGKIFSERNSYSSSIVDKLKPYQISDNIVNNQILEMLADDPGKVIVIDQNMIPRNSLGGEWGKYNFPMFHQIMRDFNIAAVDPSIRNTESATNFAHFQAVDISKTEQILGRIQLSNWFRERALETVGITPQRLGSVAASESATGVQQAVNNSYSQTEPYFDQHMNHLMPRVRQMMLDAAQFTNATKPKSRISYLNSEDQNVWFDIEGYKLLNREFKIFCKSTADIKKVLTDLQQLAKQSTAAGGSLTDLAKVMASRSPSEVLEKLEAADDNRQMQVQAQNQHEMDLQAAQQKFLDSTQDKNTKHEDYWKEREIQKDILIAQINAEKGAKNNDLNGDQVPDAFEALDFISRQQISTQQILDKQTEMADKRTDAQNKTEIEKQKLQVKREEMQSKERIEKMKDKTALKNKTSGEK